MSYGVFNQEEIARAIIAAEYTATRVLEYGDHDECSRAYIQGRRDAAQTLAAAFGVSVAEMRTLAARLGLTRR